MKAEYICVDEIGCEAWLRGGEVAEENKYSVFADADEQYDKIRLKASEKHGVKMEKVIEERTPSLITLSDPRYERGHSLSISVFSRDEALAGYQPKRPELKGPKPKLVDKPHRPSPEPRPTRLVMQFHPEPKRPEPRLKAPAAMPETAPRMIRDLSDSEKESIYKDHKSGIGFRVLETKWNIKTRHGMNAQKVCREWEASKPKKKPVQAINIAVPMETEAVAVSA